MPARRLEDRIRELCSKVVAADDAEFGSTFFELNSALREHSERLRKLAAGKLAGMKMNQKNADLNAQIPIKNRRAS